MIHFQQGTTYYSVKWKGFSSAENTWEPVENLTNAKELLEVTDFETDQKSQFF